MKNDYNIYLIFTLMIFLSLGLTYNVKLVDISNSDTLMVRNPKISKISPKIHIIGNGGWATFKSEGNCTGEGTSTNPYIIKDLEINAEGSGNCIIIEGSDVYFIIKNCSFRNSGSSYLESCIYLNSVVNGIIENNSISGWCPVRLNNSDYNLILNNTISSFYDGVYFMTNCQYNNVSYNIFKNNFPGDGKAVESPSTATNSHITIHNNTMTFCHNAIDVAGENYTITDNIIKNSGTGIWLEDAHNSKIFRNNINNSLNYGIILLYSDNATIINNTLKYGRIESLVISQSDNCKIINNTISHNGWDGERNGVQLDSNNALFLNNTISFNAGTGVHLGGAYQEVINNNVNNNGGTGVYLGGAHQKVINNNINNNGVFGIRVSSNFNLILKNTLKDDIGVASASEIVITSNNNSIYANYFINSRTKLAMDEGNDNEWNSSFIGNYWSSYTGVDANDDGIGDSPYSFRVYKYDYLPIWWDSPQILINSPNEGETFESSPSFNISIIQGKLNSSWYTLDDGITNITFTELNGVIDEVEWNEKGAGQIALTFFVNDSKGYIDSETIHVIKSYDTPKITINSPTLNDIFGFNAPNFSIIVNDLSPINATWYTLDGGLTNYTSTGLTGTLNQTAWGGKGTEMITLRFYVNDSLGFVGFNDVVIWKDVTNPNIAINSPIRNGIFGTTSPEFNISIIEENLISTWYRIDGVAGTIPFSGLTGTIDQDAWDDAPKGEITITFYALDRAGNTGSESVVVIKSIPSEPGIPGYNLFFLLGILSVVTIFISKKVKKY